MPDNFLLEMDNVQSVTCVFDMFFSFSVALHHVGLFPLVILLFNFSSGDFNCDWPCDF